MVTQKRPLFSKKSKILVFLLWLFFSPKFNFFTKKRLLFVAKRLLFVAIFRFFTKIHLYFSKLVELTRGENYKKLLRTYGKPKTIPFSKFPGRYYFIYIYTLNIYTQHLSYGARIGKWATVRQGEPTIVVAVFQNIARVYISHHKGSRRQLQPPITTNISHTSWVTCPPFSWLLGVAQNGKWACCEARRANHCCGSVSKHC